MWECEKKKMCAANATICIRNYYFIVWCKMASSHSTQIEQWQACVCVCVFGFVSGSTWMGPNNELIANTLVLILHNIISDDKCACALA